MAYLLIFCLFVLHSSNYGFASLEEEKYGVKFATNCEVCKLVTKELAEKLDGKGSSDVIETGYNIDGAKKKIKYNKSELRLLESLEDLCQGMMDYRVHKERLDSTRWAKQMSQTFKTLHGLVNKGVKVDLGIPHELWDNPSAEVSELRTQCENFLEDYEDDINAWYFGKQDVEIQTFLCSKVLEDKKCLQEPYGELVASDDEVNKDKRMGDAKLRKKSEL